MLEYILLLLSIPLGIFLGKFTKEEKEIWKKYLPKISLACFVLGIIFSFFDKNAALGMTFAFLLSSIWALQ